MIETKELQRTLNSEGKVEIVTVKTVSRYEGRAYYSEAAGQGVLTDIQTQCDIWCCKSRDGFETLSTINDWEPERESLDKDLELFQKYLDEKHGKDNMVAYALGAYVHSGVSFSVSKSEDNRCRWDSGTIGFIGMPKNMTTKEIVEKLDAAWNGVIVYEIYDNLNQDINESAYSDSWQDCKNLFDLAKKQYNIDFEQVEVQY